ncbi:MAG: DUF4091 domain-containing protein [Victivallales bacterium]|nr:DUF4091 domain-containing protein [Victivallales bacterium]
MKKHIALLCLLLTEAVFFASWPATLYLDGGGRWDYRVPIFFENKGMQDIVGESVAIVLPPDTPFIGQAAGTLRVVDDKERQLKFAVEDTVGEIITDTAVTAGCILHIPLSCPAQSKTAYYIYYGNNKAWTSPDRLKTLTSIDYNGGFEKTANDFPIGWQAWQTDAKHRISLSKQSPAAGQNCLLAEVDDDAEPSWFKCSPHDIAVKPGAKCTLTVKVRAQNVKGRAGWFVHVGNDSNSMIINNVQEAGEGTYGWKLLKINFTVPEGANRVHTGCALYGTGKVWYDDFNFTTDKKTTWTSFFGGIEHLNLSEEGRYADDDWLSQRSALFGFGKKQSEYLYRVPIRITNTTDQPIRDGLACIDFNAICRNKSRRNAILTFDGHEIETTPLGSSVLFPIDCPPKTSQIYYVYTTEKEPGEDIPKEAQNKLGSEIPSDQLYVEAPDPADTKRYAKLVLSNVNLIRNPSFEKNTDGVPLHWECAGEKVMGNGLVYGLAEPSSFGFRHAYFTVPKDAPKDWCGWRQTVEVKPNTHYIYGAWVAYEDTDVAVGIHAHLHDGDAKILQFLNTSQSTGNEHKWLPMFSFCVTPPEAKDLQIHLTMNGHGTVRHDGVLIAEVLDGIAEPMESRPIAKDDIAIWQVNPVVKTFREDLPPYMSRENSLFGQLRIQEGTPKLLSFFNVGLARNEEEPLQIAIRSGVDLKTCDISVDGLEGSGVTASIGVIGYVPLDSKSSYYGSKEDDWIQLYPKNNGNSDGWAGWWPDPIVPTIRFNLAANQTQPLWISFKAAANAKAGDYRVYVKIAAGNQTLFVPVRLSVWNFSLQKDATFPAVYDFRWDNRWNRPGLDSREARRAVYTLYKEKKVCPDHILADPIFKYDKETKTITADFTLFDKEASWYFDEMKFPVAYTPGFFYLFGWAFPPKAIFGELPFEGEYPWANDEPRDTLRPAYVKNYQTCLKLFMDHCREKGWDDKFVLYISDEPHYGHKYVVDQMKAICSMIKAVEPDLPIYSSTWSHCKDWDGYLSLWGAGHYGCFPEDEIKDRIKQGDKFWFTTDGQMCTDTPYCAIERLLPHYCYKYGADAYEFWGATWFTIDPWKYGWHAYIKQTSAPHIKPSWTRYPNGDGYLMYPGIAVSDGRPISSIRLEAARDGVEDYEYLQKVKFLLRAKENRRAIEARSILEEAEKLIDMPSAGGRFSTKILPDPNALYVLRFRMGTFLGK